MPIHQWWASEPSERFWLETTNREDLGVDLRAPLTNESGADDWHYSIIKLARRGDVVFHYHTPQDAIVAASVVAGPWTSRSIVWAARGTVARDKGIKPHERPGLVVPLTNFTSLTAPLTLGRLRELKAWLSDLKTDLEKKHGRPVYLPFEISSRPVRLLQGYGFKLARDFVLGLPELAQYADLGGPIQPEIVQPGAGSGSIQGGQGYIAPAEVRRVVEEHAMRAATSHFQALGYSIEDVSRTMPFDLCATLGQEEVHVEVKGTTGSAESVFLTRNEVIHASENPGRAALFVLSGIVLKDKGVSLVAAGGVVNLWHPWVLDSEALEPLQYRYKLPS